MPEYDLEKNSTTQNAQKPNVNWAIDKRLSPIIPASFSSNQRSSIQNSDANCLLYICLDHKSYKGESFSSLLRGACQEFKSVTVILADSSQTDKKRLAYKIKGTNLSPEIAKLKCLKEGEKWKIQHNKICEAIKNLYEDAKRSNENFDKELIGPLSFEEKRDEKYYAYYFSELQDEYKQNSELYNAIEESAQEYLKDKELGQLSFDDAKIHCKDHIINEAADLYARARSAAELDKPFHVLPYLKDGLKPAMTLIVERIQNENWGANNLNVLTIEFPEKLNLNNDSIHINKKRHTADKTFLNKSYILDDEEFKKLSQSAPSTPHGSQSSFETYKNITTLKKSPLPTFFKPSLIVPEKTNTDSNQPSPQDLWRVTIEALAGSKGTSSETIESILGAVYKIVIPNKPTNETSFSIKKNEEVIPLNEPEKNPTFRPRK